MELVQGGSLGTNLLVYPAPLDSILSQAQSPEKRPMAKKSKSQKSLASTSATTVDELAPSPAS